MDIEQTLSLMCKRPRMYVLDASGMLHYFFGIIAEKSDNGDLKDEEELFLSSFLDWQKKLLCIGSDEDLLSYYDNMQEGDGLAHMAKDLLFIYRKLSPFDAISEKKALKP